MFSAIAFANSDVLSSVAPVISRWEYLIGNDRLSFSEYAGFITTYPGFPQEERLRLRAEEALERDAVTPEAVAAFFDRNPVGRLMTRVTSDVDVLNDLFNSGVVTIFGDVLTLAGILPLLGGLGTRR